MSSGILKRLADDGWGIRNLEGIGSPNEPENRVRVVRVAAIVGTALGTIAVVSFIANLISGVSIDQYRPIQVLLIPACGAALALVVFFVADKLPLWFVHIGALIVNVALMVTAYYGGEIFVFALVPYIVVGTTLAMICQVNWLIAHLIVIAAANAYIMSVRGGDDSNASTALAGFVVMMGVLGVSAGVGAWLVGRLRRLARREHDSRQDAERARAELEVVSKHKSAFLANMSHELRTPLNAIIGFSDLLDQRVAGGLTDKQLEYVADIRSSGHHLLALINDVLDIAKVEAGKYELVLSRFPLSDALTDGARIVRERADEAGIAVSVNVAPELPWIVADDRKVRQIVLNLLSNAVKFTPRGGRIEVGAVAQNSSVEVMVRDTGIGIAHKDQERIFDEFMRADGASADGTGLGLATGRDSVSRSLAGSSSCTAAGSGSRATSAAGVRSGSRCLYRPPRKLLRWRKRICIAHVSTSSSRFVRAALTCGRCASTAPTTPASSRRHSRTSLPEAKPARRFASPDV
jgi:signal transduction histidine kinase